ncbi:MAG: hypothetical protein ACR2PL_23725 [Dehalococcoidia bacterium]
MPAVRALQLSFLPQPIPVSAERREKNGAVYTRPWVVELILDLAGYDPSKDLILRLVVEPAAGEGAFLTIDRPRERLVSHPSPLVGFSRFAASIEAHARLFGAATD